MFYLTCKQSNQLGHTQTDIHSTSRRCHSANSFAQIPNKTLTGGDEWGSQSAVSTFTALQVFLGRIVNGMWSNASHHVIGISLNNVNRRITSAACLIVGLIYSGHFTAPHALVCLFDFDLFDWKQIFHQHHIAQYMEESSYCLLMIKFAWVFTE